MCYLVVFYSLARSNGIIYHDKINVHNLFMKVFQPKDRVIETAI